MTTRHLIITETERLIIRRAIPEPADVDLYYALWTNPQVMSNVGFPQGLRITREEILDSIANERPGPFSGRLIVLLKESGKRIGEAMMRLPDEEGISETDVKLLPEFWGHRYGQEIKYALVDYLFRNTDCAIVRATPNVNNAASIKMQESVGGVCVGEHIWDPPEDTRDYATTVHSYVYHVFREDWMNW